ncbi:ATPase [Vibrio navarrensis]|uniref:ATPase n=1 Tax=Vibrio navarrensis TaxID=29495 RepID=UPI00186A7675|nr:ATPase [Vibrio navarrensis]MBE4585615.1 ATPase [Vibrio navarrensis]MBE4607852.1 ATPase [Vibrio navarrensis]MBE4611230.1 ATPase [Vibrio navarrensis]
MKMWSLVIMALLLSACSGVNTSNTSMMEQLQETYEFNSTGKAHSVNKAISFIEEVNQREPKAKFKIYYQPAASEFIDQLLVQLKNSQVTKNRYELEVASSDQKKAVLIQAQYVHIRSQECGSLAFSNKDEYRFGCSLEHNRNISLANPLKSTY